MKIVDYNWLRDLSFISVFCSWVHFVVLESRQEDSVFSEQTSNELLYMQAFQAAWAAACKQGASTVLVPSELEFLVGPISFSGPYCKPNILFQVTSSPKKGISGLTLNR
jgi:hypothetical protein